MQKDELTQSEIELQFNGNGREKERIDYLRECFLFLFVRGRTEFFLRSDFTFHRRRRYVVCDRRHDFNESIFVLAFSLRLIRPFHWSIDVEERESFQIDDFR